MTSRVALMSVRPHYAAMILSGKKTVELRRRSVSLRSGDEVLVYASSPQMAICGSFIVESVNRMKLDALWESVRNRAGVTREEFDTYFAGLNEGVAISIASATAGRGASLESLRERWPRFHPPQTFRYLDDLDQRRISQAALISPHHVRSATG